jgi:succinate dehydrogenase / fumarate reductase, cytochrome b subunit
MSVASKSVSAPPSFNRLGVLWASTVGKKALMALTGILLSLFVLGHMLGNFQLYLGKDSTGAYLINKYAEFLQHNAPLLWGTRIVMGLSVLVHAVAGVQLFLAKQSARPVDYHQRAAVNSTVSSRYMIWTGVLIGFFVVYHLLHFTSGTLLPDFVKGDVMHNVTVGFASFGASLAYIIAMVALGLHLRHGLYSLFQSLGAGNPAISQTALKWAAVVASVIAVINISYPLAVLLGLVKG